MIYIEVEPEYIYSNTIDTIPYLKARNTAQRINLLTYRDKYGKDRTRATGVFRLTDNINRLKQINFGSVQEYDIDTYPVSYTHLTLPTICSV